MKEGPKRSAFFVIAVAFFVLFFFKLSSSGLFFSGALMEQTPDVSQPAEQINEGSGQLVFGLPMDINLATAEQLRVLPGIGNRLAHRIVEARRAIGGFSSLDELKEISGLSENLIAKLKPYLSIS